MKLDGLPVMPPSAVTLTFVL